MKNNAALKALLKAADDLMVDAACTASSPTEMNRSVLQQQVDRYQDARALFVAEGLITLIGDAKPGPVNTTTK